MLKDTDMFELCHQDTLMQFDRKIQKWLTEIFILWLFFVAVCIRLECERDAEVNESVLNTGHSQAFTIIA